LECAEVDNSARRRDYPCMAQSHPTQARSRALGALAVLVLALLISLVAFLGRGGCTSTVAFDRPVDEARPAGEVDVERAADRPAAFDVVAAIREPGPKRDAAAHALSPVRGLVVDAKTGEIVPHVEIVLSLDARTERIEVGEDGRFASTADFPSGPIRAVVHDEGAVVGEVQALHDAPTGKHEWRVAVPIGPTIPFASIDKVAARVDAWRARIVESALVPEIVAELEVVESGLVVRAPSLARPDREWSWKLIRPGNPPWIRYSRHEHERIPGVRSLLELREDTANRKGSFILKSTVGVHPAVDIDTRPFAKARLRLAREPANKNLPMRVVMYDTRDQPLPGAPTAPVFDEGFVDEKGEIEFTDLDGGTKHVIGWSREERLDQHVVVDPGPTDVFEVHATRADRGSRGRVKNRDLRWHLAETVHVLAKPAVAEGRMRGWMTTLERGWGLSGDVLSGVYGGIDAHVVMGEPANRRLTRSFREDLVDCRFDVEDNMSAEIAFGPAGSFFPTKSSSARDMLILFESLEFSWSAWSAGKQPIFGDQRNLKADAGGTRSAKLDFQPGWGVHLVLRAGAPTDIQSDLALWSDESLRRRTRSEDREGPSVEAAVLAAPPIVGVTLQVDGYDEAVSDAVGEIRLRRAFEPRQLTLVGRGWRLTALEHLPGKAPRYVAWLRRNP